MSAPRPLRHRPLLSMERRVSQASTEPSRAAAAHSAEVPIAARRGDREGTAQIHALVLEARSGECAHGFRAEHLRTLRSTSST